jgi:hypothetical protein
MVHADGTDCGHEGPAQATVHDEGGPLCPAGRRITHVRFNGNTLTIEEALAAFSSVAESFAAMLTPLVTGLARWASSIASALSPSMRVLAAAAEAADEERATS